MTEQRAANASPFATLPTEAPLANRPMPVLTPPVADQSRLARAHQRVLLWNTDERQDFYVKDRFLQHILIRPGAKVEVDMTVDEIQTLHNLSRTDRGHYQIGPKAGQPFPPHPVKICGIAPTQSRPSSAAEFEAELATRSASLAAREAELVEKEARLNALTSSLSDLMGGTITICVRIAELIRA